MEVSYDLVVVGGGLSGLCCAIASARNGCRTALIHNRPVLGGNASSEIRMHVCGAAGLYCSRPNARETGIIEELLLENKRRNPTHSFTIFDSILWEKAKAEPALDLYLNCHVFDVHSLENTIQYVEAFQLTTEKRFRFIAPLFADTTGDAFLAAKAGAAIMCGTESAQDYGEDAAPPSASAYTMGNSLMFQAIDRGYRVPFVAPAWANHYSEEDLIHRGHSEIESGYWWIELGGKQDTVSDFEAIRDDLLKVVYGVWDHLKNGGDHGADNYDLVWVQALPGKRESRRVLGDYLLTANDLLASTRFQDAVAYGGWPIDLHPPCGISGTETDANRFYDLADVYQIPYRCLYASNVRNLFVGGRAFSLTHAAFASARVMGTTAVVGQAIGTAAALCKKHGLSPRDLYEQEDRVFDLQQALLRDDCYIPFAVNEDPLDLVRKAAVSVSSGDGTRLVDGVSRPTQTGDHLWESDPGDELPVIEFKLKNTVSLGRVILKFDSDLNADLMISIDPACIRRHAKAPPPSLVSDFTVELIGNGVPVARKVVQGSCIRCAVVSFPAVPCDTVRITLEKTWGANTFRMFEARIYAADA